jgi:UDP-N-acetyl-D-mannosaminuronate dehydrogenase
MLVKELEKLGAQVSIHDPYLAEYRGDVLLKAHGCHVIALITAHNEYRTIDLNKIKSVMAAPVLVDGRNLFDEKTAISSGFTYLRVGDGTQK